MTRSVTAVRAVLAALALAGLVWFAVSLPPRSVAVPAGASLQLRTHVRGVIHVHTRRSDGSGTMNDIATAASRAGLDFVVFTDHGNGMSIQPPAYRAGVLCIDAAEISTRDGHVVALGLAPSPYPLAGEGRDVVEDIHRLGGAAFAAHPVSPKQALTWKNWDVALDGFEWLNADSEWRDETRPALIGTLAHYLFRGPESVAALLSRPSALFDQWDRMSREGRLLTTYAAADAHARLGATDGVDVGQGNAEDEAPSRMLRVPSYETIFRVLSVAVELPRPLTGGADVDAKALVQAIRGGRAYSVIDGFARGGAMEFHGETDAGTVHMGERVGAGRLTRLVVHARAPVTTTLRLLRNGEVVAETTGVSMEVGRDRLGTASGSDNAVAYRVDAFLGPRASPSTAPWIVSNPIFEVVRGPVEAPEWERSERTAGPPGQTILDERVAEVGQWIVEKDGLSRGDLHRGDGREPVRLEFALGPGRGPRWVAVAIPLEAERAARLADAGVILVRLRSQTPMRVSLQLRAVSASADLRWLRSVFVDTTAQAVLVPAASMRPVGEAAAAGSLRTASSLLVVVDQVNTLPGTHGALWIEQVAVRPKFGP